MKKALMESALKKALISIVASKETGPGKLQALYDLGLEDEDIRELGFAYLFNAVKAEEIPELLNITTLRELLPLRLETDVWDSVTDELGIALVGPTLLTEEGEKVFSDILDAPVSFEIIAGVIVTTVEVQAPEDEDDEWEHRQRVLFKLLKAAAGYCSEEEYKRYFKEV